jgi:hypothetical protein
LLSTALKDHVAQNVSAMDASNIANIVYLSGKHGCTLHENELNMLTKQLSMKNIVLSKEIVSKMLYGLCTPQHENNLHVKGLLKVFTDKLSSSETLVLDIQGVSASLHSLQGMTCQSGEVRKLLSELRRHMVNGTSPLTSEEFGDALYGLQNMSSDSRAVRDLLATLSDELLRCAEEFSAQSIAKSLCGLKNMDSNVIEVSILELLKRTPPFIYILYV